MNIDQHKQFVKLLMGWPDWRDKEVRESFVRVALGEAPLLEGFGSSNHPRNDADRLAVLCSDYEGTPVNDGSSPAVAILDELMERCPPLSRRQKS